MPSTPVRLPAHFGADVHADVFFTPYTNGGRAIRTQVMLTHHLLSLVQEGEKEVLVAAQRAKVDASQLVLLSATPSIMSEHSLNGRPMRSLLMFFSPGFLMDLCIRHGAVPVGQGTDLAPIPQDAFTRNFATSVELLGAATLSADERMRRIKAEEILLYLWKAHPIAFGTFLASALTDRHMLSLRQVVAQHQDATISIPELAFLCHMSPSTFKRRFHEVFGVAPGRYLHARRMERARTLLASNARPSDIYHVLGYGSLSAFSTEFKKHFGTAPTVVR